MICPDGGLPIDDQIGCNESTKRSHCVIKSKMVRFRAIITHNSLEEGGGWSELINN